MIFVIICRSFILIRGQASNDADIVPSRLEQQLIPARFPSRMEQWLGATLTAKLQKQQQRLQAMHLIDSAQHMKMQQQQQIAQLQAPSGGYIRILPVVNIAAPPSTAALENVAS